MAQMIRKQIYIDAEQDRFLKQRSAELGVSEAEIIRQALGSVVCEAARQAEANDRITAWEEIKQYIEEHRTFDAPDTGWKFNREELYDDDERFQRLYRR